MEKLKNTKSIICIVIAIIIIAGVIIGALKGFNIELFYQSKESVVISNNTGLDVSKIEEISKSVLGDKRVVVQEVERFGNSVQITSTSISDEEKQNIITKINEEYSLDISADEVTKTEVPATRIRDILNPYILPGSISIIVILLYFIIVYHKIGIYKVVFKTILIPVITEVTYYSIIAITRLPFGRIVNAIALGLYIVSISMLTICFKKAKESLTEGE